MQNVDVVVGCTTPPSTRALQVCGMFDCSPSARQEQRWHIECPMDERPWSIGLIVGPSGSGKTTVARSLFPTELQRTIEWDDRSLVDNFPPDLSIDVVTRVLGSVGFSTIPAWVRPFSTLSNGEQFRATLARRLMTGDATVVVDEFTSVVDRQVAKVASYAIQKTIRKTPTRFVAVSCHYDIEEWLQPDWIIEPAEQSFRWRSVRQRPPLSIEVARLPVEAWQQFSRYHYLTASLHRSAQCFGLWCNGTLAAFGGVLHRPHAANRRIKGLSRLVTLPDWQGLGLGFVLMETLGAAYKALGYTFHTYPAHPAFVRSYRLDRWQCRKQLGDIRRRCEGNKKTESFGDRPCAVFRYVGAAMSPDHARAVLDGGKR